MMDSNRARGTQGYEQKLQQYEAAFAVAIHQQYPLSHEARQLLQHLQQSLDLRQEIIDSVETQVTQAHEQKLQQYKEAFNRAIQRHYLLSDNDDQSLTQGDEGIQQYKEAFTQAIHQQYPLGHGVRQQLQQIQQRLDLNKDVINFIEAQVTQAYEQKLQQYQETFTTIIQRQYSLGEDDQEFLANLQHVLNLSEEITQPIERQVTRKYEQKLQQYEAAFTLAIQRQYSLDSDRTFWDDLQQALGPTNTHATQGYEQKLQQYEKTFTIVIHQQYPLGTEARQLLQMMQQNLELKNETIESIEAKVTQGYEQKLQQYETAFNQAAQRQYPLSDNDCKRLEYVRHVLNLNQKITNSIEELENLRRVLNLSEDVVDAIETKVTEAYKTAQLNQPTSLPQRENTNPTSLHPSTSPPREAKKGNVRRLPVKVTVIAIALTSIGVVTSHLYNLWQANRFAKADLESTKLQKERKSYAACASQAKAIPQTSRFFAEAQDLLHQCQNLVQDQKRLAQAKELATQNSFQAAIATATQIQPDSSLRSEAQQSISRWSENLLHQAERQYTRSYNANDLDNAIKLAQVIPSHSTVAQKAKSTTEKWREEWSKNETLLQDAQNALRQGKWTEATDKANQVKLLGQAVTPETPYWQTKIKPIVARADELRTASTRRSVESNPQRTTRRLGAQSSIPTTRRVSTRRAAAPRTPTRPSTARQSPAGEASTQSTPTQQPAPQQAGSSGWTVEQE